MKAILPASDTMNGKNYAHEKELVGAYSVIGRINGELREVVCARAYMGRSRTASTVYASIWVHGPRYCAGHGQAGGYGYHKESAAFAEAIRSAGIDLYGPVSDVPRWNHNENREYIPQERAAMARKAAKQRADIGGVGESAMRAAFEAIARASGARGPLVFVSH